VRGEFVILTEGRATEQTCGIIGEGQSSAPDEVAVYSDRAPAGHSRTARPSRRGSGGRGGIADRQTPVCGELLILGEISNSPHTGAATAEAVLCAYVFDEQGTRHVVYAAEDGDVHELWWNSDGWHHNDLTSETGASLADLGDPAGYIFVAQGTQHVDYIGIEDSHIHELRWQRGTTPIRPVPPKSSI
jgi:hypothetical protein